MKINDPYLNQQFKTIKATTENAAIDIQLLREENERLTELLDFLMKKSGDIHSEQTA
jgi:cell shape-determining protein MreC